MSAEQATVSKAWKCLSGGGAMGAMMRAHDWAATPVGPVEGWPQTLQTAIRIMLASGYPIYIAWGSEFTQFYNDAYRPILGATKHPAALGQSTQDCFAEIWDFIGPMFMRVMTTGENTTREDQMLPLHRYGYAEECYFTLSYSALPNESGESGGVFVTVIETTARVLGERRLRTLRELAAGAGEAKTAEEACESAARILASNPHDVPFALLYLREPEAPVARLARAVGLPESAAVEPEWLVNEGAQIQVLSPLPEWLGSLPSGPWPESPHTALVLPLASMSCEGPAGVLVAGISPRLALGDDYRGFLQLVAGHIANGIANARAYEQERKRAEALAELDRAKTAFFSNVSHEFRTPLTLILAPAEDVLADSEAPLDPRQRARIETLRRNALRLLKLVNTLLDFSRIEAGRIQAVYEPTELASFTADLAGEFRAAVEHAGMRLIVDCPPLPEPIYVDREMWEKVVLNLLSNAFKFTLEGEIAVRLRWTGEHAELEVRDSGCGIPENELPHLFERFHRVKGARARTEEGTGIGLALVHELVRLHGGSTRVESAAGQGTSFFLSIPAGKKHLPEERIQAPRTLASTAVRAASFVEEALRWLPEHDAAPGFGSGMAAEIPPEQSGVPRRADVAILLADDNADMRDYLKRLLDTRWTVEAVGDGISALEAARRGRPNLILTDVMMPGLDGFELLRALRAEPSTREIPVIVLSARAGEESRIEGLKKGADDYLVKPFSARELLARIGTRLELSQVRRQANEVVRQSEERYRLAARATSDVLWDWNLTTNEVTWNESLETRFGWPPSEACGDMSHAEAWWTGRIHPDDVEQTRSSFHQAVESGAESWVSEYRFRRADGTYAFVLDRGYLGRDGDGKLTRFIGTMMDITERKIAEEERNQLLRREQEARASAEAASRAKDEFLATISHELRTPLNAIFGWARLLKSGNLDEASVAKAIDILDRNARTQAQLIEDLLDISRIITGKLRLEVRALDLQAVIEEAIESVRPAMEAKGIRLTTKFDSEIGQVSGDTDRLQQIFWNLLSNAAKFTNKDGRIHVESRRVEAGVEVSVTDNGQGLRPELIPLIFQRFWQADASSAKKHGGLGLGLALVRNLAELHGGSVTAESEGEGKGTTVRVTLPLLADRPREPDQSPAKSVSIADRHLEKPTTLTGLRALVVDDEEDARGLLLAILKQCGAEVSAVSSAGEALKALAEFRPDLLISDIGMPGEDGYQLIRKIRALEGNRDGKLPAIAVTAFARQEDRQRALAAGYQVHIRKPIDPADLIAAVQAATGR